MYCGSHIKCIELEGDILLLKRGLWRTPYFSLHPLECLPCDIELAALFKVIYVKYRVMVIIGEDMNVHRISANGQWRY